VITRHPLTLEQRLTSSNYSLRKSTIQRVLEFTRMYVRDNQKHSDNYQPSRWLYNLRTGRLNVGVFELLCCGETVGVFGLYDAAGWMCITRFLSINEDSSFMIPNGFVLLRVLEAEFSGQYKGIFFTGDTTVGTSIGTMTREKVFKQYARLQRRFPNNTLCIDGLHTLQRMVWGQDSEPVLFRGVPQLFNYYPFVSDTEPPDIYTIEHVIENRYKQEK
jgi:hypothetical protein